MKFLSSFVCLLLLSSSFGLEKSAEQEDAAVRVETSQGGVDHTYVRDVISGRINITESNDELQVLLDTYEFLNSLPDYPSPRDDFVLNSSDPRTNMDVPQLIKYYGYDCEVHRIETQDGYMIELHRLKNTSLVDCDKYDKNDTSLEGKCQPVFLQHGFLSSSASWIMNYPERALAYILADLGFDVWMGNARGNQYSRGHKKFGPDSYEYWDFDFDQMAKYDLPAAITHILKSTHRHKLHYIGHSMGTMMFWILENVRPGFAKQHVASMSALGPVAYLNHIEVPFRVIAPTNRYLDTLLRSVLHIYNFLEPNNPIIRLLERVCSAAKLPKFVCANELFLIVGFNGKNLDMDWLPVILHMLNGGTSIRTLVHFGQITHDHQFRAWNYYWRNWQHYHQSSPPVYSLDKVSVPVLLAYGMNDPLADYEDVYHLAAELPPGHQMLRVANSDFTHLDFLWGKDAKELVYDKVIDFINENS